jgi:hypothetical protein
MYKMLLSCGLTLSRKFLADFRRFNSRIFGYGRKILRPSPYLPLLHISTFFFQNVLINPKIPA